MDSVQKANKSGKFFLKLILEEEKIYLRETQNLSMCADSSINTKTDRNRRKGRENECVMCQEWHVMRQVSSVMCHMSPVTCHMSPVTCHMSPVTIANSRSIMHSKLLCKEQKNYDALCIKTKHYHHDLALCWSQFFLNWGWS